MPRPDPNSPTRRMVMLAMMWTIFLATLAMAYTFTRRQQQSRIIDLSKQPTVVSDFALRLPTHWKTREITGQSRTGRILEAAEPGAQGPHHPGPRGRTLTFYRQNLTHPISPLEFLAESFDIQLSSSDQADVQDLDRAIRPTRFGTYPGVMLGVQLTAPGHAEDEAARKEIYAAAVLPDNQAVALELSGIGDLSDVDYALLDQVAATLKPPEEPQLAAAGQNISLENGAIFTVPSAFSAVERRDPNRTDVRLWHTPDTSSATSEPSEEKDLATNWASIELVPCIFPVPRSPTTESAAPPFRPQTEFLTMLLARDARWRGSSIQPRPNGEFQADMPLTQSGALFPTRAYLHPDRSGHAVLAILRGPGEDLESYWNQIRASLHFAPAPADNVEQMVQTAIADVARLRELPLDELLKQQGDSWRLIVNQSSSPYLGFSHTTWTPRQIAASIERRLRLPDQAPTKLTEKWSASPDHNRVTTEIAFESLDEAETDAAAQTLHQSIEVLGDSVSLETSGAKNRITWKQQAPANFIPGSLLPHLLPKLSPAPMIIKTDSIIAFDLSNPPAAPLSPFTLIIRPTNQHTITVEVQGTGQRSQWHFSESGALLTIDYANTIQSQPSTENTIKLQLDNDHELMQ